MFQSLQVAAGAWLLAIYYRQSWKKSKVYKITFFFKMARGGKWLRVAADGCNQLQPLAATCPSSHLPKQPLALAATCSHLQPLAQAATCPSSRLPLQPLALAATCSHLQPLAATCPSSRKWLQVTAFSKIKMMHVCSLSAQTVKQTWIQAPDGTLDGTLGQSGPTKLSFQAAADGRSYIVAAATERPRAYQCRCRKAKISRP